MSIKTNILFKNLPEIKDALRRINRRAIDAGNAGIYALAVIIMREAKSRTPIDTGALIGSAYVTLPKDQAVEFGYGGPAEEYAVVQHETDWYNHRVGEDHYFLNALDAYLGIRGLNEVAKVAANEFKRKGGGGVRKASDMPTNPWSG